MKDRFRDLLFNHHILVPTSCTDSITLPSEEDIFGVIVTLGYRFAIRITEGANLATQSMISDAARCLGEYVPEPFYKGFPRTVRSLTPDQLLYDQLLHYAQTYGLGKFDNPGHSAFEDHFERLVFAEKTETRKFRILSEKDAEKELLEIFRNMLSGTRPLSNEHLSIIREGWNEYGEKILPEKIPCKMTNVQMYYYTGHSAFTEGLKLQDVIKLLSWIQYSQYGSENLKKLNLRNQDRKRISHLMDILLSNATVHDMRECWEKKQIWCGLLHHIHYHPTNNDGEYFVYQIRNGKPCSLWSTVDSLMKDGQPAFAAKLILKVKGPAAFVRNLDYILSRCKTNEQRQEVFKCLR